MDFAVPVYKVKEDDEYYRVATKKHFFISKINKITSFPCIVTGLLLLTCKNKGLVVDFEDWNNVKFYDVEADTDTYREAQDNLVLSWQERQDIMLSGEFYIKSEVEFSKNRQSPRIKRAFAYKLVEPIDIRNESDYKKLYVTAVLEIYKVELMFIGAIYHSRKLFEYISESPENRELINDFARGIEEKWVSSSEMVHIIRCKYSSNKDSNNMADIVLTTRPSFPAPLEYRLLEGPGFIKGYVQEPITGKHREYAIKDIPSDKDVEDMRHIVYETFPTFKEKVRLKKDIEAKKAEAEAQERAEREEEERLMAEEKTRKEEEDKLYLESINKRFKREIVGIGEEIDKEREQRRLIEDRKVWEEERYKHRFYTENIDPEY